MVLEEFDVLKNVSDGAFEQCLRKDLIELRISEYLELALHLICLTDCFLN